MVRPSVCVSALPGAALLEQRHWDTVPVAVGRVPPLPTATGPVCQHAAPLIWSTRPYRWVRRGVKGNQVAYSTFSLTRIGSPGEDGSGMGSEYQSLGDAPPPTQGLPNWYPDPIGQGPYRYWNGERWTEAYSASPKAKPSKAARTLSTGQLAPLPTAIPAQAHIAATAADQGVTTPGVPGQQAPGQPQFVYVKAGSNGLAVAGLVCGIIGVLVGLIPIFFIGAWILGVLGLVFGLIARSRANDDPEIGRKTMATWAAILGVVAVGLGVVGVVIVNDATNDLGDSLEQSSNELDREIRQDEAELDRELRRDEEQLDRELEAIE